MPYKINERITDIRIAARGRNLEQLFNDALLGMMYILKPVQKFTQEKIERDISIEAIDATALLADFLNEVLFLASANKESYTHVIFYKIQPTGLRAKLFGISAESFHREIKAVTYHEAEVKQADGGAWETVIIIPR